MTCPPLVDEFADQTVDYVERALGVRLEFNSETLPILDHYVRQVPAEQPAARDLIAATAGAYFGEVIRRTFGGSWVLGDPQDAATWRMVLPGGLSFSPAGFVAAAIAVGEVDDFQTGFDVPQRMASALEAALDHMAEVTEEVYYSLSGRYDTLEHLQDVLVHHAARELGDKN